MLRVFFFIIRIRGRAEGRFKTIDFVVSHMNYNINLIINYYFLLMFYVENIFILVLRSFFLIKKVFIIIRVTSIFYYLSKDKG